MALGSSAGRSSRNRTGEGASRRATQRERDGVDAPRDEEPPLGWVPSARTQKLGDLLAWTVWAVFCVVFALVICAWFGLL